ncbi:MAG: hydroxymethylbilane synthase [Bdellovibrionota bacterium]
MANYKIGTRGSLLAVTQSTLMKNELERISGESFELVLIKTQGDEVTNKPLWQLEGKDFFTKELDEALLKGEVDLVIHSYKDLGSVRPEGIKLAAVTERKFAHDILLISQETINKLPTWEGEFVVGTSSPRRITNLTAKLGNYIPHLRQKNAPIRCETLRGNVNTRISKLREGQYHAITLALAGLERLSQTHKSAEELSGLLKKMNYLILPQSTFPSAASQGALGIETREDRDDGGKLFKIISQLSHERTVEEVIRERKAFKEFGGGCHLAVGIHVKKVEDYFLHVHAGEVDGKRIEKKWLEGVTIPTLTKKKLFVGLPKGTRPGIVYDEYLEKVPAKRMLELEKKHVFITSRYCLPSLQSSVVGRPASLWAAGSKTAGILTEAGFWINGTSDSLGTQDLQDLRNSMALRMMNPDLKDDWLTLSHDDGKNDLGAVIGCYKRVPKKIDPAYENELREVGACFWSSYPEYQNFVKAFPFLKETLHFCGLGKTWDEFRKAGIKVTPLPGMEEFYALA